jgi:hypothetical protein
MAIACDRDCPRCRQEKQSVYICLKSEAEFLSSLLRLGADEQGKINLLGYDPSHLIDWFLYAKRSSGPKTTSRFDRGLKLLDELGKLLFDIGQVTARDNARRLLLMSKAERKLVDAFIESPPGSSIVYEKETEEARKILERASRELKEPRNRVLWQERYSGELEIRSGFVSLKNWVSFNWEEMKSVVWLLQWSEEEDLKDRDRSLAFLARAYLHGVARFALGNPNAGVGDWEVSGYWIDPVAAEEGVPTTEAQNLGNGAGRSRERQTFCGVPTPSNPAQRLACEASATFLDEFLDDASWNGSSAEAGDKLFDLFFMCKGESGWFWTFSKQQYDYIAKEWHKQSKHKRKLRPVLEIFRFKTAGFINLLEGTGSLIVELHNFRTEKFICESIGYQLEDAQSVAKDFADAEALLPGVATSSFYFLRISSHGEAGSEGGEKSEKSSLSEGALVAQFRISEEVRRNPAKRLKVMASIRAWVERWRAKDHSLARFSEVIRDIERPLQRRTARAAIISRNLSHNIGSHALANSRFFEAIGVLHLETSSPNEREEKDEMPCLHGDLPPGRRKRHLTKGEVWRARGRLGTLNSYLQGRLDFIARALGETTSHPEPMFFVNDLLKGFLSQAVLLNTFLSDNGFTCDNMEFRISLPGAAEPMRFHVPPAANPVHDLRHVSFELENQCTFRDLLIAIPGGMVGRHAFYAFMENLMRNAAKYGTLAHPKTGKTRLIVNLRLEERRMDRGLPTIGSEDDRYACYELTITENLSPDGGGAASDVGGTGKIALKIRTYLNEDIIDEAGQLQTQGHGIQEMKVCAQFLAGGDRRALVFPSDRLSVEGDDRDDPYYRSYLSQNPEVLKQPASGKPGSRNAWMGDDVQNSLRCLDLPCEESGAWDAGNGRDPATIRPHLAYRMILQRPVLLGVVSFVEGEDSRSQPVGSVPEEEPSVVFYNTIETLASSPAYFGLVLVNADFSPELLQRMAAFHTALPYRLMVVVEKDDAVSTWRSAIESWQKEQARIWWASPEDEKGDRPRPFPLPPRRIHVIHCAELFGLAQSPGEGEHRRWQSLICTIYEKWLVAFKGHELSAAYPPPQKMGPWHLFIGFERDATTIRKRWFPQGSDGREQGGFTSGVVHLHLFGSRMQPVEHAQAPPSLHADVWQKPADSNLRHAILALDNHGKVFPGLAEKPPLCSIAAYHPFSGTEQVALFQMLDNPPAEEFSRALFIYAVVESLLTRIVVVDERVAEATVEAIDAGEQRICEGKTSRLQTARIYPIYSIQTEVEGTKGSTPFCLSETVAEALQATLAENDVTGKEGLAISPVSRNSGLVATQIAVQDRREGESLKVRLVSQEELAPDCLVIHEGVVDVIHDRKGWPTGLHRQLHSICPWVVRTSGRGSMSRHLGNELPFLDFSELSDTTYRQVNKVALAKGILSLRGGAV